MEARPERKIHLPRLRLPLGEKSQTQTLRLRETSDQQGEIPGQPTGFQGMDQTLPECEIARPARHSATETARVLELPRRARELANAGEV